MVPVNVLRRHSQDGCGGVLEQEGVDQASIELPQVSVFFQGFIHTLQLL